MVMLKQRDTLHDTKSVTASDPYARMVRVLVSLMLAELVVVILVVDYRLDAIESKAARADRAPARMRAHQVTADTDQHARSTPLDPIGAERHDRSRSSLIAYLLKLPSFPRMTNDDLREVLAIHDRIQGLWTTSLAIDELPGSLAKARLEETLREAEAVAARSVATLNLEPSEAARLVRALLLSTSGLR